MMPYMNHYYNYPSQGYDEARSAIPGYQDDAIGSLRGVHVTCETGSAIMFDSRLVHAGSCEATEHSTTPGPVQGTWGPPDFCSVFPSFPSVLELCSLDFR